MAPDTKMLVIYQNTAYRILDPDLPGVTFVAIQTQTEPPYVWATYFTRDRGELPKLPEDLLVLPVAEAKSLFEFRECSIADLVR